MQLPTRALVVLLLLISAAHAAPPSSPPPTWEIAPHTPPRPQVFRDPAPAPKFSLSCWGPHFALFGYPRPPPPLPAPTKLYATESDALVSDITPDWFPYPVASAGTPVDLSFLNKDPSGKFVPAGAHVFLQVHGDHFQFADGTAARFFGVNCAAYS